MKNEKLRTNEQIKISPVVVINPDGRNLGSLPLKSAINLALECGLDLVEISPLSRPPVCRIMDYGKYRFNQNLKEKRSKKIQSKVKEIRLSPSIEEHDVETKVKSAVKFLQAGHRVNIRLEFKRRQIVHQNIGIEIMNSFLERLSQFGKPASRPKMDGRVFFCVVDPILGGERTSTFSEGEKESKDAPRKSVKDI